MGWNHGRHRQSRSSNRGGDHESGGFNAIGNSGKVGKMELIYTIYDDCIRASAANFCAQSDTKIRKINHFRFLRRIFDYGLTFRKCRRHHQGFGRTDTRTVKINLCSLQSPIATLSLSRNDPMINQHICTQSLQTPHMQFYWTRPDRTATGKRHFRGT